MTESLTAAEVADWLERHPEFLAQQPQLLMKLKIPHDVSGPSLIEYQVSVLQDKVQELKQKLQHYHDTAARNETLLATIHGVQLELMQAESLDELLDRLKNAMEKQFDCQRVSLGLFDADGLDGHPVVTPLTDPSDPALFDELARAPNPVVGRLRRERLDRLFGDASTSIHSAAVATLDRQVPLGLLALGSSDEHKFHPGMGTLFLSLLAQTLGHCLAQHLPELQQQA